MHIKALVVLIMHIKAFIKCHVLIPPFAYKNEGTGIADASYKSRAERKREIAGFNL